MTASGSEYDALEPITLWVMVPERGDVDDLGAWAREIAAGLAADHKRPDDTEAIERLVFGLEQLASRPLRPGFAWRFAFFPDLDQGFALHHVALVDGRGDAVSSLRRLTGADQPAPLGVEDSEFELDGLRGLQVVAFETRSDDERLPTGDRLDERAIVARASVAVRRDLPTYGATDLLSVAESAHLEPLMASLVPCHYLLTGDIVPALLGHVGGGVPR